MERQRYLYDNIGTKFPADVQFHFKKEEISLHATKMILGAASSVFETMLYGSMALAVNEPVNIDIDDISSDVFREILRFVYLDEVSLFNHNIGEVIYGSHKYQMSLLEKKCIQYMQDNLNAANAALFYQSANILEVIDSRFHQRLLTFIDENMEEICTMTNLLEVDAANFLSLTKRSTLCVSEYTLFKVALEWTRRVCEKQGIPPNPSNRKSVFEEFKSIRFHLMTKTEFNQCSTIISSLNISTSEEEKSLRRRERQICFELSSTEPELSNGSPQQLQFLVSKYTILRGFEFFCTCRIKLIKHEKVKFGSFQHVIYERKEFSPCHQFFPAIILVPNHTYTLKVKVCCPRSQFISSAVKTEETSFVLKNRIAIIKRIIFV